MSGVDIFALNERVQKSLNKLPVDELIVLTASELHEIWKKTTYIKDDNDEYYEIFKYFGAFDLVLFQRARNNVYCGKVKDKLCGWGQIIKETEIVLSEVHYKRK